MNQRKQYLLYSSVAFGVGFVIYGLLALAGRDALDYPFNPFVGFLLYGFLGGLLIGGLLSGILLFARIIKMEEQVIKVLAIILFPITFCVIALGGIISFIPYWIFNLYKISPNK